MTTSSSSVIIILVLNIFFSTPSFVSSTETRNDDVTLLQLQTLVQQQGVTIQQQAALLQTLQAKLTAEESVTQQLQAKQSIMEARQNKKVAFTATFTVNHPVNIGDHGIAKFNNVITNIGGAYNAATGIFTAPLAGTYAFFFSGQGDNVHGTFMEVSKNGNSRLCVTVLEGPAQAWFDKGTCSAVSHLNAGDQVYARQSGSDTYINGDELSSLSGFLLQAD